MSDRLTELAQLQSRVRELTQEVGPEVKARMSAIVTEMNALAAEGKRLADDSGMEFDLSGLNFLPYRYDLGSVSYRPNEGRFEDWNSSSAYC